ncbi:hypothetical protein BN126_809 [Cronobacter sakazakii 680]|nr:hypothetical protein BN126_809 [Cronobacter sakazakii 680]
MLVAGKRKIMRGMADVESFPEKRKSASAANQPRRLDVSYP